MLISDHWFHAVFIQQSSGRKIQWSQISVHAIKYI